MRRLVARNASLNTILADKVGVADSRRARAVGLLTRSGLEPGEALWIVPSRGVHTWGMRFTIEASSFCHQMVRSIVGTLVEIGHGKKRPGDVMGIIAAEDRHAAGQLSPPYGLCLWEVRYDG